MPTTLNSQAVIDLEQRYLAPTYKRAPFVLERGRGVEVWDMEGRRYLDFIAGISVNPLGHCPPVVQQVLLEQGARLMHVSNLYHSAPHALLARDLCESSFADRVFFCNSGTEASEGAIKFARKVNGRPQFISFTGSFHGRSTGALSITSNERYRTPFEPLLPGARFCPFNDLEATAAAMSDQVSAIFVEPIQGEGGIIPAAPGFLQGLRDLCQAHGALLIFDEVQCGLARTGRLWAHQHDDVTPDIMTLAKPLGSGLPIGAILMTERVAAHLAPGDHGSTFAGGPLVCAVAQRVFAELSQTTLLTHVAHVGEKLGQGLRKLPERFPLIKDVRGRGLMWGLALHETLEAAKIVERAAAKGLLLASAGGNTVRFLPPLVVGGEHVEEALQLLAQAFEESQ